MSLFAENWRWLVFCGCLASGEFMASLVPLASGCWPFPLGLAVGSGLFGYGLGWRGWGYVVLVFLGLALYFAAATDEIERNRDKPWMREHVTAGWRLSWGEGAAQKVRDDFSRRLSVGLGEQDEMASLGRVLLLGEKRSLPRPMKRLFVESGTMHVFAISGLHVMTVAKVIVVLLGCLWVPRRVSGVVALPILWGYVAVIGFSPSAVRAALMATFNLSASLFWRKSNGVRSWCLAFLVVHLVNPTLISHVGNALSFAVMLAIVLVNAWTEGLPAWKRTIWVTLAAWAVGVPISAHVFGCVTPGGLLANLVLISMACATVKVGAIGLVASYLSMFAAAHLNNLMALGVRAMVFFADAIARLPGANFETGAWNYGTCFAWYVAFALTVFLFSRIRLRRMMV